MAYCRITPKLHRLQMYLKHLFSQVNLFLLPECPKICNYWVLLKILGKRPEILCCYCVMILLGIFLGGNKGNSHYFYSSSAKTYESLFQTISLPPLSLGANSWPLWVPKPHCLPMYFKD